MPPRSRKTAQPKPDPEAAEAVEEPGPDADESAPERSDIRTGSEPCTECFPGGWAAQATVVGALGCGHGTWQREVAG